MLYLKCPTCSTILANKQLPYEKGLEEICQNNNLTKKESDAAKKQLLNDLEVRNICCRQRMLTYVRLIDVVK